MKTLKKSTVMLSIFVLGTCIDFDVDMGINWGQESSDGPMWDFTNWVVNFENYSAGGNALSDTIPRDTTGNLLIALSRINEVDTVTFFGSCSTIYNDSTYYATHISFSSNNFFRTEEDIAGYYKIVGHVSTIDTISSSVIVYGYDPVFEYRNKDTSYTFTDTMHFQWDLNPIVYEAVVPDSLGNFRLDMILPTIIRSDTVHFSATPYRGSFAGGDFVMELGTSFTIVFQ